MKGAYHHLDIRERAVIEMQLELGTRPGVIARYLNRARPTITRELHRDGWRRRGVLPRSVRRCQREAIPVSRPKGVPID
jgi:transposase, IS30 family